MAPSQAFHYFAHTSAIYSKMFCTLSIRSLTPAVVILAVLSQDRILDLNSSPSSVRPGMLSPRDSSLAHFHTYPFPSQGFPCILPDITFENILKGLTSLNFIFLTLKPFLPYFLAPVRPSHPSSARLEIPGLDYQAGVISVLV